MMYGRTWALILALASAIAACAVGDDGETAPIPLVEIGRTDAIVFDKDIFPILAEKCTACHDREGGLAEGELDLLTLKGIEKGGTSGPAIEKGKGGESLLVKLAGRIEEPHMPPEDNEVLTSEELSLIKAWIDGGALPGENLNPAESMAREFELGDLPPGVQPVYAITVDASGGLIAAGQGSNVAVFDAGTGKEITQLTGHRDLVQSVRFSADGKYLAAGGFETVLVWPRLESAEGAKPTWGEAIALGPVPERATSLAFSPDSKQLAVGAGVPSASGEIALWDVASGTLIRRWTNPHSDVVYGLAISPDGKWIASGSADRFLKVHSLETGELVKSFEGHTGHVLCVGWNQQGSLLASGSSDQTIKVWNFETGERAQSIGHHGGEITSLEWLWPVNQLLTTCGDRHVRLLQPGDGKVVRAFGGAKDYLLSVASTPDGKRIVAGCQSGEIFVWDGADGKLLLTLAAKPDEGAVSETPQGG